MGIVAKNGSSIKRIGVVLCAAFAFQLLAGGPGAAGIGLVAGQQQAPNRRPQIPNLRKPRPKSVVNVGIIELKGTIDYQLAQFFRTRFNQAKSEDIDLLIVEIDSPGGLLNESLEIAEKLRDCDWAYTVALIPREAISGAALIALGVDEIVIDEKAVFGDIGAIYREMDGTFRYIPAKMNSYLVADAGNIAESKGRPRALAEALIDKDVMVYWRPKLGGHEYQTVRVDAREKPGEPWELIAETGPERFLTVSGARAIEIGIAQSSGADRTELAELLGYSESTARVYTFSFKDSVVYYLNTGLVTGLLVVIGLIALYLELSAPGISVGGLIAGLCAVLFFWSRFLGGTSTWLEVLLFLAGTVFLVVEVFVIPGWGLSGLMGLVLILVSIVMASQEFVVPSTGRQWNQLVTTLLVVLCAGCVFIIAAIFITRRFGMLPMFNRLILTPQPDTEQVGDVATKDKPLPAQHPDVSVGDWGVAESLLRPAGRARFNGRSFDVVSDGSFISAESQVKVVEIGGNRIVVVEVEDEQPLAETTYQPQSPEAEG